MKNLLLSLVFICFCGILATAQLSKEDKKYLFGYMNETTKAFKKSIKGLSDAQLNWKPNDSVWSIANVIEHLAISEKNLDGWAQSTLKEPAKKSALANDNETVKKIISGREQKVKTREEFIPTGQFNGVAGSLEAFDSRRKGIIEFLENTNEDLHAHFAEGPFGVVDTYQIYIFLAGHVKRHTLQIEEVKTLPGYPQ